MVCLHLKAGEICLTLNFIPVFFGRMQKIRFSDDVDSHRFNQFFFRIGNGNIAVGLKMEIHILVVSLSIEHIQ